MSCLRPPTDGHALGDSPMKLLVADPARHHRPGFLSSQRSWGVVCASLLQLIINGYPPPNVTQPSLLMNLDHTVTRDRTGILFD